MQTDADQEQRGRGRPSSYRPEHALAARSMSLAGFTRDEITEELGIDNATFHRWMLAHKDFCDAVKTGRDVADERVVNSLYTRALNGSDTAAIFWLKNRRPKEWRDKIEVDATVRGDGALGLDGILSRIEQLEALLQGSTTINQPSQIEG